MRSLMVVGILFCLTISGCGGGRGGSDGGDTNAAPVANAGPDQNVATNSLVTLNGSGSTDADGDPLTYEWIFVSTPQGSNPTLSDATAVNPTFTADVLGSYVLSLVVNDGTVASAEDTVLINTTIEDYSSLFSTDPNMFLIHSGSLYLQGSLFRLKITNNSNIPFVCTRAELRYGDAVVNFTEDPTVLRANPGVDNVIDPAEFVDVTIPLPVDVPDNDVFEFRYYLTRPATSEEFIVFHQYLIGP